MRQLPSQTHAPPHLQAPSPPGVVGVAVVLVAIHSQQASDAEVVLVPGSGVVVVPGVQVGGLS